MKEGSSRILREHNDNTTERRKQQVNRDDKKQEIERLEKELRNEVEPSPKKNHCGLLLSFRERCGALVNHPTVQLIIIAMISISAIQIGIGTFLEKDENDVYPPEYKIAGKWFDWIDLFFLIMFTVELALQFIYLGIIRLLKDAWQVFDTIIILSSWFGPDSVKVLRALRIFRALRLITRVKTLKNLVVAIFSVIPSMGSIILLLFVIIYIIAVLCTETFSEGDIDDTYWNSLQISMLTLFQITTMDGWTKVTRETMKVVGWSWILLIIFLILTGIIVLNLLIAVICEAVSESTVQTKEKLHGVYSDEENDDEDDEQDARLREAEATYRALEEKVNRFEIKQDQIVQSMEYMIQHIRQRKRHSNVEELH
mmetsp:Transcript_23284/g.26532  ORF Transcript_23284/g.26532 Transcript_23284/m.26532 type:complete len:369 (+) Transcript_23284:93-1199(+)